MKKQHILYTSIVFLLVIPLILANPPATPSIPDFSGTTTTTTTGPPPPPPPPGENPGNDPTCEDICSEAQAECGTINGCSCGECDASDSCESNVCVPPSGGHECSPEGAIVCVEGSQTQREICEEGPDGFRVLSPTSSCASGETCDAGECISGPDPTPECSANNDCEEGFVCTGGECVPEEIEHTLNVSATYPLTGSSQTIGEVNFSATINTTLDEVSCALSLRALTALNQPIISENKNITGSNVTFSYEFEELGQYLWKIICNQEYQGVLYTNESGERSLNIVDREGILNINNDTFFPGDVLEYELRDFFGEPTIAIDGLIDNKTLVVTSDVFTETINISINATAGNYTFKVNLDGDQLKQDETTFKIVVPEPELLLSSINTTTNNTITIFGDGFLASQEVNLSITRGEYSLTDTATTDDKGKVSFNYTTNLLGNFTIEIFHLERPSLNATSLLYVHELPVNETQDNETEAPLECEGCEQNGICYPIGAILSQQYCGSSGFESQKNDGETCSQNFECRFGQCISGTCGEEDEPEFECRFNSDCQGSNEQCQNGACIPRVEQPTPVPPPTQIEEESSSSWLWWIVIFVIFVALIGGFFGFLAYEDSLDMSSFDGFIDGIKDAFGMGSSQTYTPPKTSSSSGAFATSNIAKPTTSTRSSQPLASHEQKAISYIQDKRSQGYDDLTIRNALLKQGWPEEEVDGVFDKLYH